jgi:hypothetical protein
MRYQRYRDSIASPAFTKWYVKFFAIAALIGLLIGIGWVIAGLVRFHVLD